MRYLDCASCLETLDEPYTLPCGFTVCKSCFPPAQRGLHKGSGRESVSVHSKSSGGDVRRSVDDARGGEHALGRERMDADGEGDEEDEDEESYEDDDTSRTGGNRDFTDTTSEGHDGSVFADFSALLQTYSCPARSCFRVHQYRQERPDVVVRGVVYAVTGGVVGSGGRMGKPGMEEDREMSARGVEKEGTKQMSQQQDASLSDHMENMGNDDARSTMEEADTSPNWELVAEDTFDCHLCLGTLHDPITTPCGHTWCRSCIVTSLDHSRACPLCRRSLPSRGYFLNRPSNRIITTILWTRFPEAYNARSFQAEGNSFTQSHTDPIYLSQHTDPHIPSNPIPHPTYFKIPIFVCALVFPNSSQGFHIFEPRYRVLVQRAMRTNRQFGICLPSPSPTRTGGDYMPFGSIVEITSCESVPGCELMETSEGPLPRYLIETRGVVRCRIVRREVNPDGYNEAWVERVEDVEPEDEGAEMGGADPMVAPVQSTAMLTSITQLTSLTPTTPSATMSSLLYDTPSQFHSGPDLVPPSQFDPQILHHHLETIHTFLHTLHNNIPRPAWHHLINTHGSIPSDPADLSFWLASIINRSPYEKWELLPMTSVVGRLERVAAWVLAIPGVRAPSHPPPQQRQQRRRRSGSVSTTSTSSSATSGYAFRGGGGGRGSGYVNAQTTSPATAAD
ncbi:hypothetical protein HK097_010421 [Rhizophlyctis rosea]|uniref:Uncharacterized protein n=1 Tax=Rhizophlyctis rosea TaxID=64517 RepID=A0AAD5SI41_9FUNG|nr:hypothetical protein HK097_010421 [Rhizophlyctis rosea]